MADAEQRGGVRIDERLHRVRRDERERTPDARHQSTQHTRVHSLVLLAQVCTRHKTLQNIVAPLHSVRTQTITATVHEADACAHQQPNWHSLKPAYRW